jgi:hypothetical protein
MEIGISTTLVALFSAWIISNGWFLYRNYTIAKSSGGVPIIICPLDPDNLLWMIIKVPLRPTLKRILPRSVYDAIKISIFGWEFRDKYALHAQVGSVFWLVNPGSCELWVADPAVAQIVLARRKDFIQLPIASFVRILSQLL